MTAFASADLRYRLTSRTPTLFRSLESPCDLGVWTGTLIEFSTGREPTINKNRSWCLLGKFFILILEKPARCSPVPPPVLVATSPRPHLRLNDNLSNNDCHRRSQHDSPRLVCFQHGPGCLRYHRRKEAWRASTTPEINQPAMIPPTITLYSRAGGNRFWNFLFLAQSRMAGVFDAFHVGRFISSLGQSGPFTRLPHIGHQC